MEAHLSPNTEQIEKALFRLHSLGNAVTQIAILECQEPDLGAIAYLGRIIAGTAMALLETMQGQERS